LGVTLTSAVRAAVLILGREILRSVAAEVLPDGAAEACRIIGASRSQAYEMLARLKGALEDLQGQPGRPPRESTQAVDRDLLVAVRDFLMQHPGCVEGRGSRRVYHVKYRDFVLRQLSPGGAAQALTQEQAADVFGVPLGTIKDWMAGPGSTPPGSTEALADGAVGGGEVPPASGVESADPIIALILREFPRWKGSFGGFCGFLEREWRVPYGRTFVASILEAAGLRQPNRQGRERRPWSEDTFRQLFPGAQWIGDGKTVIIEWQGQPMAFNFEALVDVATNAIVGVEVSDTEDEQAVLAAHAHAQATTSGDPIAVTLDQRPSNHTETVREAVAPAQLLASTKARPTAKAPMEGCFGLFSQMAPPLVVAGTTPREQAKSALKLYILGWAWARNGRPRRRLGGRTPTDVYQKTQPTAEEIAQAKAWADDLRKREEMTRQTLEAKADPVRRQLLDDAFPDFGITDPDGRLAMRLAASYAQEAIVRGLATFRAKTQMGTVPAGADRGRYLAGIIRNIHGQLEDIAYADALLDLRLRHRDLSIRCLEKEADRITRENPASGSLRCWAILDRALQADPLVDFRFWVERFRKELDALSPWMRRTLYRWMTQHISRAYRTLRDRRRELIATLSATATVATG
jgi:transposase InsO family protein